MSVLNQEIFRKGLYTKQISNKLTLSGTLPEAVLALGVDSPSCGFANYDGTKINITESGRYRIVSSFYTIGNIQWNGLGGYGQFKLLAGSTIVGSVAMFPVNIIDQDNFGRSSFWSYSSNTMTPSSLGSSSISMNWSGLFNCSADVNLSSGDDVKLAISVSNGSSGHSVGFSGFISLEQIS